MKLPQILLAHGPLLATSLAAAADVPNVSTEPQLDPDPTAATAADSRLPLPGLYLAKPYTALVYVPQAVDNAALIKPRSVAPLEKNVLKPPLQLIPKQLIVK